ncbi:T9SS type A sorting domain-containing protein [Labilibacter sediminis]|nr:T9SS type A sorting domain-containing protein [Labilibacter sediminis]
MKKTYLFLFVSFFSAVLTAQRTESFDNIVPTTINSDGTFIGDEGFEWKFTDCKHDTFSGDESDGSNLAIKKGTGVLESPVLSGGIGEFSATYVGGNAITLYVDFNVDGDFSNDGNNEWVLSSGTPVEINHGGSYAIKIANMNAEANGKMDDLVWSPYVTTAVTGVDAPEVKVWANQGAIRVILSGGANGEIGVYDIAGELLISQLIADKATVAIESGLYIVKISVRGKVTTFKVVVE